MTDLKTPVMKVSRVACIDCVKTMEKVFRSLEVQVPSPVEVWHMGRFQYRYEGQHIEQALVQKLARQISGLYTIDILLLNGMVQEQAVIQRTLDEIGEDIFFLAIALTNDHVTDLHKQYLKAFWQEEFDADTAINSTQKRDYPPRRKIVAFNSRLGKLSDPSLANEVGRTISKMYSGYVHASSPQIMDMCVGDPPKFMLRGMAGTSRISEHAEDAWNYYYRGLMAAAVITKAFGNIELLNQVNAALSRFESRSDTEYSNGMFSRMDKSHKPDLRDGAR